VTERNEQADNKERPPDANCTEPHLEVVDKTENWVLVQAKRVARQVTRIGRARSSTETRN
jgi:hypothetical protein